MKQTTLGTQFDVEIEFRDQNSKLGMVKDMKYSL